MSPYRIVEVDGSNHLAAETIHRFNRLSPDVFPELESRHLENGYWFVAYHEGEVVAFAGMVPFEPFPNIAYLKRAYVLPDHRGHGLQLRLMVTREVKAQQLGWTHLVSECSASNTASARNFARAGFERCDPEQKWGASNSIYFVKRLS